MNDIAVGVEDLHKAAHVGAFELLGQVHEHANGGHGVLHLVRPVANLDGKAQSAHADFIDRQFPEIPVALHIMQFLGPRLVAFSRHGGTVAVLWDLAKMFGVVPDAILVSTRHCRIVFPHVTPLPIDCRGIDCRRPGTFRRGGTAALQRAGGARLQSAERMLGRRTRNICGDMGRAASR